MQPLICSGHTRPVVDLCFTNIIQKYSSSFILSASKDGLPMLRSGITGDWIGSYLNGHKGAINCVCVDQLSNGEDKSWCVTGSADFTAVLWETLSGKVVASIPHPHMVRSVDLGRTDIPFVSNTASIANSVSTHLLSSTNLKEINLWNLERLDAGPELKMLGHNEYVRKVVWHPSAAFQCISASDDKTVKLWDLRTGTCIETFPTDNGYPVTDIEFSRHLDNNPLIGLFCNNSRAFLFELALTGGQELRDLFGNAKSIPLPGKALSASYARCNDGEEIVVCGGSNNIVYKCRASGDENNLLESYPGFHFGAVNRIRFSPDKRLYATASDDGTLRLFQTRIGDTYGLWKSSEAKPNIDSTEEETAAAILDSQQIKLEKALAVATIQNLNECCSP